MFSQALEGLKGVCGAILGLKHISVTKKGNRAGMRDSIVPKMLKKITRCFLTMQTQEKQEERM